MAEEFAISRDVFIRGALSQAWWSVTDGLAGWMFPGDVEHRVGGSAGGGSATVMAWEPESHVATRSEGPDGWFNELSFRLNRVEGGVEAHYEHRGILPGPDALEGTQLHTDFYLDALVHAVEEFPEETAVFVQVEPEGWGTDEHALDAVLAFLGIDDAAEGARVSIDGEAATIDWIDENFFGVRTATMMWRFFARNRFGGVLALAVHDFTPGADPETVRLRAEQFLRGVGIAAA